MERIPEPELMNEEAQARAYAEADFEEPHARFIELLTIALPGLSPEGAALDLGCGPGDITLRFARAFPSWTVDGIDGAEAMLRHGFGAAAREGLEHRVTLAQVYLPDGTPPRRDHDLVFSNSLLHHLGDATVLWTAVKRFASPGAGVFVMDLLRPATRTAARDLVVQHAAAEPDVLRRDFFNSLLAAYTLDEVKAQLTATGLGHLEAVAASDRHLTVSGWL